MILNIKDKEYNCWSNIRNNDQELSAFYLKNVFCFPGTVCMVGDIFNDNILIHIKLCRSRKLYFYFFRNFVLLAQIHFCERHVVLAKLREYIYNFTVGRRERSDECIVGVLLEALGSFHGISLCGLFSRHFFFWF